MKPGVRWFEVWTDDDFYVIVLKALSDGTFEMFDPQNQRGNIWKSYEEAAEELAQDEFRLVEGRESEEDS